MPLDVDTVLKDVQHGGDVLTDAGVEQGQGLTIVAQLGDLPDDQVVDVGGQLGAMWCEGAGDVRYMFRDRWTHQVHPRMVCPARHGEDSFPRRLDATLPTPGIVRTDRNGRSFRVHGPMAARRRRHNVSAMTAATAAALPDQRARRNPRGPCLADERQALDNAQFADRRRRRRGPARRSRTRPGRRPRDHDAEPCRAGDEHVRGLAARRGGDARQPGADRAGGAVPARGRRRHARGRGRRLGGEARNGRPVIDVSTLDGGQAHADAPPDVVGADGLALLIYTSGTTGRPKGVMLDHANISATAELIVSWFGMDTDTRCLLVLPLFHVNGIMIGVVSPLLAGGSTFVAERFDAEASGPRCERVRPDLLLGRARRSTRCWRRRPRPQPDTPSLRFVICGGRPDAARADRRSSSSGTAFRWSRATGCRSARCAARSNPLDGLRKAGHGRARRCPAAEVRVVDETDQPLPAGEAARWSIRGPNVMHGYLGGPRRPRRRCAAAGCTPATSAGSTRTATCRIVDRVKDLIIRGGENIYPKEIENVLLHPPGRARGRRRRAPGPVLGEEPVAFVALRPGATSPPTTCSSTAPVHLARYKVPRAVCIARGAAEERRRQDRQAGPARPAPGRVGRDGGRRSRAIGTAGDRPAAREVSVHAIERPDTADTAAPLDALLVDAALGSRRFLPDASTAKLVGRLLRQPRTTGRPVGRPGRRDRQGRRGHVHDRPGHAGPPVHRPGVDGEPAAAPGGAGLPGGHRHRRTAGRRRRPGWRDEQRVRFLVENLVEALAPSNVPLVNPASAKAAIDTAGLSLVRGGLQPACGTWPARRGSRRWWTARRSRSGATSPPRPGAVVLRTEVLELIQYTPQTEQVREVPLLIVPPTINKYYALDLAPGRSLVEYLRPAGPAGVRHLLAQPGRPARRLGPGHLRAGGARRARRGRADRRHRPAPRSPASAPAASSPAWPRPTWPRTGRQDRLAALHPAGDRAGQRRRPARRPRWSTSRLAAAAKAMSAAPRLPRRPGAGRGVRLAAPGRPDLELLGQQLPARQASRRRSTSCSGTPTPPG